MKYHVIMFQPRFARLVESGAKLQTIRPKRKREIKPGDRLSLREWTGKPYRSKQRILREAVCVSAEELLLTENYIIGRYDLAGKDGFMDAADMIEWFQKTHGLPFTGTLIKWKI